MSNPVRQDTVNEMIDEYFSREQERVIFKQLSQKLQTIIGGKYKKVCNSLKKISYQIAKKDRGEEYKKYGDLILANLYNGKDFSKSILLKHYAEANNNDISPLTMFVAAFYLNHKYQKIDKAIQFHLCKIQNV